ncbi:hypothetical protein FRC11_009622 [Ceratobasidium sp. 423]|nr:hypothetical protein FRC11_009622 [Ceratobasidium sp. 423]
MAFTLNLEIRDSLDMISNAVTSSGTRGGTQSKELQKTVLNMLKLCQIPNIPPPENHVATQGVLSLIGSDLIDYRSATKTELSKRKPGGTNMDLGSFVANLTRNTNVKITKEHYGRVAFLSHEYRRWDSHDKTNPELVNVPYWDWVDKALENAHKKYGNRPGKVNQYIQSIIDEDEKLFSKAIGTVASPEERENWQRQVEMASSVLPAIVNN